ncbi:MAG TPA: YvcK family protein [Persephonella sp.]|nr:YvcK family protein [Persephonella sp.]
MKVVAVGGGTGLSSLLRGIKHLVPEKISDLSAIVTVADNGGSSGRLREEMQIPAPGDIRNCIVALAEDEDILAKVFQYRFTEGEGLKGHSFGNLFLSVLTKITGDFLDAVEITSDILKIKGRIIPSTDQLVDIAAQFTDGTVIKGETQITEYGKKLKGKIKKIWMEPENVSAPEEAVEKIKNADVIILGPGSLYTSIIPNLLVNDIKNAILESNACVVYICNVMTQYGETDQFTASDHIKALHKVVKKPFIDIAVVNTTAPPDELIRKYMKENAEPVTADIGNISRLGITVYAEDLLDTGSYVRHNPEKLASTLVKIFGKLKGKNAA